MAGQIGGNQVARDDFGFRGGGASGDQESSCDPF
jgi:hypothetical protein